MNYGQMDTFQTSHTSESLDVRHMCMCLRTSERNSILDRSRWCLLGMNQVLKVTGYGIQVPERSSCLATWHSTNAPTPLRQAVHRLLRCRNLRSLMDQSQLSSLDKKSEAPCLRKHPQIIPFWWETVLYFIHLLPDCQRLRHHHTCAPLMSGEILHNHCTLHCWVHPLDHLCHRRINSGNVCIQIWSISERTMQCASPRLGNWVIQRFWWLLNIEIHSHSRKWWTQM